jgi:hypothetical protein
MASSRSRIGRSAMLTFGPVPGRLRRLPIFTGASASEKAVIRLCSAIDRRRPTTTAKVASGGSVTKRHSRTGEIGCKDAFQHWSTNWRFQPIPDLKPAAMSGRNWPLETYLA